MLCHEMKQNIYLIGPMGAGKTTVGNHLARLCNRPFYDSDLEIETQSQQTITQWFSGGRETDFRREECRVIERVTRYTGIVLATGGGSVLDARSQLCLQHTGLIIYLSVSVRHQLNRLMAVPSHGRPLIHQVENKKLFLMALKKIRDPIYKKLAHAQYYTDGLSPLVLAKKICTDQLSFLSEKL